MCIKMVRVMPIVSRPVLLRVSVMAVVIMVGLILVAAVMAAMRCARDHEHGIVLLVIMGSFSRKPTVAHSSLSL